MGSWTHKPEKRQAMKEDRQSARHELAAAVPPVAWDKCAHKWIALVDSMFSNDRCEDVRCDICGCPGERTIETGDVYWPAT